MENFDTHKFMYTLFHEGRISGHKVVFLDREGRESEIVLSGIEIGASPVSCKLIDEDGRGHRTLFIRIRKVFFEDELVWDNTDVDVSGVKVIKGYE